MFRFPRRVAHPLPALALLVLALPALIAAPALHAAAPARSAPPPTMEKYVSPRGDFVLYRPVGWTVSQTTPGPGDWQILVEGPRRGLTCELAWRPDSRDGVLGALGAACRPLRERGRDLAVRNVRVNRERTRVVYDFAYTDRERGRREGRGWIASTGHVVASRTCEAPEGRLRTYEDVLLTILGNVRIMRGGFGAAGGAGSHGTAARPLPLATHSLADGSASFGLPAGWTCRDLRAGQFLAGDSRSGAAFLVGAVDFATPRLGVRAPGVPVSPYLGPVQAWPMIMRSFMRDLRFESAEPLPALDAQIGRAYTAGPVRTASLVYTFRSREGRACRGCTFGISYGSRLGTNWKFWHITVTAPADAFASLAPTFAAMVGSYRIRDEYARDYIARGMAHLQQMQAETRERVTRNADDIHAMMQSAYDERQRSQDWLDYERTNVIRGEQDWVSGVEGGAVWHTDAWGTRNTTTGQSWEGAPFDVYHWQGETTGGDLVPVNDREVYERVFR